MKESDTHNPFELESLEPRILLSVDPVLGMAASIAPDNTDLLDLDPGTPPLEESYHPSEDEPENTFCELPR